MSSIAENIALFKSKIPRHVNLVAVSKTKPIADVKTAYDAGQRIFGENKIQEMTEKQEALPKDIEWHMIGHVQTNKVKYMAPYVHLIHAVESFKLLKEINKQAHKNNRTINCLLQLKIASEDTKFGMAKEDLLNLINNEALEELQNIHIVGLMGMASFSENEDQIKEEFHFLKSTFDQLNEQKSTANITMEILSMGMSGDYKLAIDCGSNMIRVGSAIFGQRNYN